MTTRLPIVAIVLCLLLLPAILLSQTNGTFNYQAALRQTNGQVMKNTDVELQFSIIQGTIDGQALYVENHIKETSEFGIVQLNIGAGSPETGDFGAIDWSAGPHFISVAFKENGEWISMGTSPLVYVPYAKFADQSLLAQKALEADTSAYSFYSFRSDKAVKMTLNDLTNVIAPNPSPGQVLKWSGEIWMPDTDLGSNATLQTLSITGNELSISDGNTITLPASNANFTTGAGLSWDGSTLLNTGDVNPNDDLTIYSLFGGDVSGTYQNLLLNASSVGSLHLQNFSVTTDKILDGSITLSKLAQMGASDGQVLKWNNQLKSWLVSDDLHSNPQSLFLNGNTLSISDGNAITLPSGPSYSAGSGISIQNNQIINSGDTNAADDITQSSLSGGDLSGTFTNLKVKDGAIASNHLAPMNAQSGQVLKWDGNSWKPGADNIDNSWSSDGNHLSNMNSGNIGIGLASPSAKLHISTDGGLSNGLRVSATNSASTGASLLLDAAGIDWSIYASNENSITGNNKLVFRNQTLGQNHMILAPNGFLGIGTDSPSSKLDIQSGSGEPIIANITATNINSQGTILNAAYTGNSANKEIVGVMSKAVASSGYGIGGSFEGGNYGVKALAEGGNSTRPIYGLHSSVTGNNGVRYGIYTSANGIPGTSVNYGIYSTTNNLAMGNYAGFFDGNVHVSGVLSKSSGSFKIDHPTDPANKYLIHSFVESPDMMNVYNGNIITDKNGLATVTLPEYFEDLNESFRYQLTVIGTFARAIVKEKVANNQFVIMTDEPQVEVSWQVTGIRKDPYAKNHPIIPVVEKPASEKGTYLHPELYNQPAHKKPGFQETERK